MLPTSTCGLNLHEPRYLSLIDAVLTSPERRFGAIYSKLTPQVVIPQGKGDYNDMYVPMIRPGDIGVVCEVLDSEELETSAGNRMVKVKCLRCETLQSLQRSI